MYINEIIYQIEKFLSDKKPVIIENGSLNDVIIKVLNSSESSNPLLVTSSSVFPKYVNLRDYNTVKNTIYNDSLTVEVSYD